MRESDTLAEQIARNDYTAYCVNEPNDVPWDELSEERRQHYIMFTRRCLAAEGGFDRLLRRWRWPGTNGPHYRLPLLFGHIVVKPTADELFSERWGFAPTLRIGQRSFVWMRYR